MKRLKEIFSLLEMDENLKNTINKGFDTIFESYADVRYYSNEQSPFDVVEKNIAMNNKIMNFLYASKKNLENLYNEFGDDSEPELDKNKTINLNLNLMVQNKKNTDMIEDSLGLTAKDLYVRNKNKNKTNNNNGIVDV